MNMKFAVISPVVLLALLSAGVAVALPPVPGSTLLFDNGPFITGDGSVICNQPPGPGVNTSSPTSGNATLGSQSRYLLKRRVDDFTVPADQSWTLAAARWRVYQLGTVYDAVIPDVRVRIWATEPGTGGAPLWGDLFTNRQINSTFTNIFRTPETDLDSCTRAIKDVDVSLSGLPPLPPGRYWIEIGFDGPNPGSLLSPPTEPRLPTDNALETDFSGAVTATLDDGTALPLEYPFQLYGSLDAEVSRACALPGGGCVNTTLSDCRDTLGGAYNYFNVCSELGACCNHATGQCTDLVGPQDCAGPGKLFRLGVPCSGVQGCGQTIGACCFPNDTPVDCQSFSRGVNCTAQGGFWHPGSCSTIVCNEYCETAQTAANGDTAFENVGNTTEYPTTPNDCGHDPFVGQKDAWFRHHATLQNPGGAIEFSLCHNTTFPATLQIYRVGPGTTCADLAGTAAATFCNVGGCGATGSPATLTIPAAPDDEFLVRIGGYNGAEGGGTLRITPIEADFGACCRLDGTCQFLSQTECLSGPNNFTPLQTCELPGATCGPTGGCCRGFDGCQTMFETMCLSIGGTFLGVGAPCGSPADCDGDGQTNICAIAAGAVDCNHNGIPDACDVTSPGSDCDGNGIPDECQPANICCPGDVNADARIDGRDIALFAAGLIADNTPCFTRSFCRVDMNGDFRLDVGDVSGFVARILQGGECPPVIHVTARRDTPEPDGSPNLRKVYLLNAAGTVIGRYDAVAAAQGDAFGYRDGASDVTNVYFGWTDGVARHDADGANGEQIIFGPVPSTGASWRALAYDPTGDNGHGSFWTQSFTSDLVETTLTGELLGQYSNDLNLYGLAYDTATGKLWGHNIDVTNNAFVVEIDTDTGLPTGVAFPSAFGVPGGSTTGLALYGGLEMDPMTQTLFGVLQGTQDALFSAGRTGTLAGPLSPNPRIDLGAQLGTQTILGVTVSRP